MNCYRKEERIVHEHLVCEGFADRYTQWIFHGERGSSSEDPPNFYDVQERDEGDDISALLRDLGVDLMMIGENLKMMVVQMRIILY